jgi:hypothetical protein
MSRKFVTPIDLGQNELQNAVVQNLSSDPGAPIEGQAWYNTTSHVLKVRRNGATLVLGSLDQITAPAGDVSLNSHKITSLATPSSDRTPRPRPTSTASRPAGSAGSSRSGPPRPAAGTLASSFENGDAIDGVTLATGDRILVKNQSDGTENGIYVVAASGAPTRATDADAGSELAGATVIVREGTTNADQGFTCTNDGTITLGSTALAFVQITALGQVTAGAGLTKTGATLDVVAADGSITVAADSITVGLVPVGKGGTNATDATTARSNLGAVGKYAASVGDGASTSIAVTHNLGTTDVIVQLHRVASPFDVVEPDIQITDVNTVTLLFASAPSTNQYRVVVTG